MFGETEHQARRSEMQPVSDAKKDEAVGRVKEAAGALTGDDDLEREGRRDRAGAKIKQGADKARQAVERAVDKTKDALSD
jgi:uncharacterized protein YjbJ (UPF0337 family)